MTSLDELRLLVIVDNATDTLSSIADGVPQTPEVAQHLPPVPISRIHDGHPGKVVFDRLCCAAHGLSVLATGRRGRSAPPRRAFRGRARSWPRHHSALRLLARGCGQHLARRAGEPIDVVLGGYHLSGKAMETRIEATVGDLKERIRPRVVAPGHCTGWRATAALAQAFAPARYGPSAVGTQYTLRAP
jgi:hypothetical protein